MIELEFIKRYVEAYLQIDDISDKCRRRPYLYARWAYYTIAKLNTKFSLHKIGKHLDVDHATVLNSFAKYEDGSGRDYLEDHVICISLFVECAEDIIKTGKSPTAPAIRDYISRLRQKAIDEMVSEIRRDVPFIGEYNGLCEEAKKEFNIFAKAKIEILNKKY